MKTFILLVISLFTFNLFDTEASLITSNYACARTDANLGRCTGSAYCSICSNCSRCGHCSNGGSCGVCRVSSSSSSFYSSPKSETKKKVKSTTYYESEIETKVYVENEFLFISKTMINLREEPNNKSKVIEKLYYGDSVVFIEKNGEWSKVKSGKTENVGFVLTKLLNF
jgi:uncharacterized protein YgiM (DUF1202 family)